MKMEKIIFSSKQPKIVLKYVPATLFVYVSGLNLKPISLKKEISHFSKKSLTPDMQKNSKNGQVSKKNYFARNNLKNLKICSKHYLYSF